MPESAARAERFDAPSSSPSSASYLWEIPGKPVAARISLDLVERLEQEVVENFRSLDARGSEIGGVLLGTVAGGGPARISIDRYELVPCDYSRGPLYRFSEKDVERFARAVASRSGVNGPKVVGFFRSHTRKGLGLDAEDITFFSEHFREPHQVALLIRPYASKASTAGIFIWENGTVKGDTSYREFPFRRLDLERGGGSEPASSQEASTAVTASPEAAPPKPPARAQIVPIASRREISIPPPPAPVAAEVPAPPAPEARSAAPEKPAPAPKVPPVESALRPDKTPAEKEFPTTAPAAESKSGKVMWIAGGSAVALVLLGGMLVYPGLLYKPKRPAVPGQDDSALSLRVERSQGELLLTWNRDSDAVKNATRAVLYIVDGEQHADVNMDLAQLQNGSIVYTPSSGDVSFQLAIMEKDASKTQSESLRVLRTRPSPMPDNPSAPKPAVAATAVVPNAGNDANGINPVNGVGGVPGAAPEIPPSESPEPQEAKPAAAPLKPFVTEAALAQRLRPARPSDLPDAPGLGAAEPAAVAVPGVNLAAPAPPQAVPAPQATAPAKLGGQLQPALIVSRTNPEYPLAARQARVQGTVVVQATVGTDGKIKSAKAVSGPPLLHGSAVAAVKQWSYKPAFLNGAPVESETHVELNFTLGR